MQRVQQFIVELFARMPKVCLGICFVPSSKYLCMWVVLSKLSSTFQFGKKLIQEWLYVSWMDATFSNMIDNKLQKTHINCYFNSTQLHVYVREIIPGICFILHTLLGKKSFIQQKTSYNGSDRRNLLVNVMAKNIFLYY